jgi:hypothetical protein
MCEDSMLTIGITKSEEWGLENIFCVIRLNESVREGFPFNEHCSYAQELMAVFMFRLIVVRF